MTRCQRPVKEPPQRLPAHVQVSHLQFGVKAEKYFEAVSELLSGRFRILQHSRCKRVVIAGLQQPTSEGWKTITGCSYLLSVPWPPKTVKILQNTPSVQSE
jgi:hypothetical protein